MLLDRDLQENINEVKDSSNNTNLFRKGLRFSRKEVSGKVRYEYDIFLDTDPTSSDTILKVEYAKEQLENIIIGKKVEDKVAEFKRERAEE